MFFGNSALDNGSDAPVRVFHRFENLVAKRGGSESRVRETGKLNSDADTGIKHIGKIQTDRPLIGT